MSSSTHMVCHRLFRFAPLLLLIFFFLYISVNRLPDSSLRECIEDGKPCAKIENDVIAKEDGLEKDVESFKEEYLRVLEKSKCTGKSFQIGKMVQSFHHCVTKDNEILLEHYLEAWRELIKFMDSMGSVFTFISHETTTKINILQGYLNGENGKSYQTIKSMIEFELENHVVNFKYLPSNRVPSGCRTLLRMHRALKWLEVFLYKLGISSGQDKTSEMCAEAYHKTLSHYHSWFIRQVAEVAFLALPPIEEMHNVICVRDHKEAKVILLTTVDSIVKVYNITQELYTINNMLDLP